MHCNQGTSVPSWTGTMVHLGSQLTSKSLSLNSFKHNPLLDAVHSYHNCVFLASRQRHNNLWNSWRAGHRSQMQEPTTQSTPAWDLCTLQLIQSESTDTLQQKHLAALHVRVKAYRWMLQMKLRLIFSADRYRETDTNAHSDMYIISWSLRPSLVILLTGKHLTLKGIHWTTYSTFWGSPTFFRQISYCIDFSTATYSEY